MKKLFALTAIVLALVASLYTVDNAFADKMWAPSATNLSVDLLGGATAVDFYYTLNQDGQPLSTFKIQIDDSPSFSSPNIDVILTSATDMQNINVSSLGSGNTVYWRVNHKSTQLASSQFTCP